MRRWQQKKKSCRWWWESAPDTVLMTDETGTILVL